MEVTSHRPGTAIILVNGTPMGKLACGATLSLAAGFGGAPPFPWRLDVVEADGRTFGDLEVPEPWSGIVIRSDGVHRATGADASFSPALDCRT